jgi:hypothetical protein
MEDAVTWSRLNYEPWRDFVVVTANDLRAHSEPGAAPLRVERQGEVDLRHLLNAAWLCRVPPAQYALADIDNDQLLRLGALVSAIALSWLVPRGSAGGRDVSQRPQVSPK